MTLSLAKNLAFNEINKLWSRKNAPENAGLWEIVPHIQTYWDSAEVDGYESSITIKTSYTDFIDYVGRIDSKKKTCDSYVEAATMFEELFMTIPNNVTFESSDVLITPGSILSVNGSLSQFGKLAEALVPLFKSGYEGSPRLSSIINTILDFFTAWEVEVDDNGTPTTVAII